MELKQIGRYEIQRRLGKGGMGSLYLARDPGLDRLVAIKLLKDDYLEDQEFRERFSREARALARLRHPNIVVVFDFGEHDGRPFMAMEYIDGETLRQRLTRIPPLKLALGLAIVEDLCAGLASAHDAGIVHRDIKPDNIMIDRQGVLKLLDFGIARTAHAESTHQMTQPGMIMGTYNYMSPEQLLGEMVDKRSDIFAVGAVLYQVIAREQAFPGAFGAVYHRVLTAGPVPLEERVPDVDPTLVRIVMRALQRDPKERYQDANDMRRDLLRARQRLADRAVGADDPHETVVVPRGSPSGRRQKDSEAKRGLVTEQLRLAREAFERGDHDIALQYGERAAFVDPDNAEAIALINKSRVAIDAKSVLPLVHEANRLLSENHIQEAQTKAEEASAGVPDLVEAEDLRATVQAVFDQIVKAREREDRIAAALERARLSFDRGEFDTALRAVYEVLALDPERAQAREFEQHAKARLQARREHEQARRQAHDRLKAALTLADEGRFDEASAALNAIAPPSDTVRSRVADALAAVDQRKRQARADEAVAEARGAFAAGDFERAVSIIEAIPLDVLTESADQVRADALESLAQQRELDRKRQVLEQLIASAGTSIDAGELTQARRRLAEAADLGLQDDRLGPLRQQLEEMLARVEGQRRQQALDREAGAVVEKARALFTGNPHAALAVLEQSGLEHPEIEATLDELRGRLAQIEERAKQERERQAEAARRAAQAEAERVRAERERAEKAREQQRLAAEQQRLADEARQREQQRIAAEHQHLEDEAREQERQRAAAEQEQQEIEARRREEELRALEEKRQADETRLREEQFPETIVRPTPRTPSVAKEPARQPEPTKQESGDRTGASSWWGGQSAGARAAVALVALSLASALAVGGYRLLRGPADTPVPTVAPPGSTTPPPDGKPAPPDEPVEPRPSVPPEGVPVESRGTVVLDALPWAEVVSIVDLQGNRQEIPANSITPLTLTLPIGEYNVTFRNGSTRTTRIRITNDGVSTMNPVDFGKVDAAEYLQRQGWQ